MALLGIVLGLVVAKHKKNKVKELRAAINITQIELADFLGITQKSISAWETGRNNPSFSIAKKLMALAKKHKIPMTYEEIMGE